MNSTIIGKEVNCNYQFLSELFYLKNKYIIFFANLYLKKK